PTNTCCAAPVHSPFSSLAAPRPPSSTLFPYTTLFRSVVVVDPRQSDTVQQLADEWIALRPGTDVALIAALAHVMISEDLQDQERSEEHTSELQSREKLVCRLLLEKKKNENARPTSGRE